LSPVFAAEASPAQGADEHANERTLGRSEVRGDAAASHRPEDGNAAMGRVSERAR